MHLTLKNSPFPAESLVIVVGITGEIRGQAVISMGTDVAKSVASAMMMGMPVDTLDDLAKKCIVRVRKHDHGELCYIAV